MARGSPVPNTTITHCVAGPIWRNSLYNCRRIDGRLLSRIICRLCLAEEYRSSDYNTFFANDLEDLINVRSTASKSSVTCCVISSMAKEKVTPTGFWRFERRATRQKCKAKTMGLRGCGPTGLPPPWSQSLKVEPVSESPSVQVCVCRVRVCHRLPLFCAFVPLPSVPSRRDNRLDQLNSLHLSLKTCVAEKIL